MTRSWMWLAGGIAVGGALLLLTRRAAAKASPGTRYYVLARSPETEQWVIASPSYPDYKGAELAAEQLSYALQKLGQPDAELRVEGAVADTMVWLVLATPKDRPELGWLTVVAHVDRTVAERVQQDLAAADDTFTYTVAQDWLPHTYLTGVVAQAGQQLTA